MNQMTRKQLKQLPELPDYLSSVYGNKLFVAGTIDIEVSKTATEEWQILLFIEGPEEIKVYRKLAATYFGYGG